MRYPAIPKTAIRKRNFPHFFRSRDRRVSSFMAFSSVSPSLPSLGISGAGFTFIPSRIASSGFNGILNYVPFFRHVFDPTTANMPPIARDKRPSVPLVNSREIFKSLASRTGRRRNGNPVGHRGTRAYDRASLGLSCAQLRKSATCTETAFQVAGETESEEFPCDAAQKLRIAMSDLLGWR